jgi:hypothetical protein
VEREKRRVPFLVDTGGAGSTLGGTAGLAAGLAV